MKKTTRKLFLMILITIILTSCSSIGQFETNSPNISETVELFNIETPEPILTKSIESTITQTIEPLYTPLPIDDLEPGELPVVLSYIEEIDGERYIISTALNFQSDYAMISVERGTDFRGQAAVDSDLNLYILYGSRTNFLSKLSRDGEIETLEIPYNWTMETGWVGHQLFVMANAHSMSLINTDLEITTLSPALNDLEDGLYDGTLRTTTDPSPTIIWTFTLPVADETGDYALYRTLSLDTLTTSEYKLKIPDTGWSRGSDSTIQDPAQRVGTLVYTVDLPSENVFLCYGDSKVDEFGRTVGYFELELYASKIGETATTLDFCCLNNGFHLRGNSIITMDFSEGCGATQVLGLNNLQPIFDVTEFLDTENYYDNLVDSNGVYWQVLSKDQITVIYSNGQHHVSYPIPFDLPENLTPGDTLRSAFLIDD